MSCGNRFGYSASCHLEAGHPGDHTNGRVDWDDAAAQRSRDAITKAMKGRTD